jgi:serine protease inhibitor
MHVRRLSPALLALALAACSSSGPTESDKPAPKEITALPRVLSADELAVIGASNAFGFDLLRELNKTRTTENVFISPISASMALGMTMNGTAGQTFDEMRSTLKFGTTPLDRINTSYGALITMLRGLDPAVDFRIANSIWYRTGFPVDNAFITTTRNFFDARVSALDFGNASAAEGTINSWVDQSTGGKIKKIVEGITDEVMFLINAIYFKGNWTEQFDKTKTRDEQFTTLGGTKVPVKMMNREGKVRFAFSSEGMVADLAYGGNAYTMTIFLPTEGRNINDAVTSLTAASWAQLVAPLTTDRDKIQVSLPKFTLEWEATLNNQLQSLGMKLPFSQTSADFSRLSPSGGPGKLFISMVKQKTFVDVNEEGTEAAAATSVGIMPTSLPPSVRVDRPFIFAIRERLSGTILFVGKIVRP